MRRKDKPLKWRTKEGIPGCWGESGVYYNESYSEAERTALEYSYRDFDRYLRRKNIIFAIAITVSVLPVIALILLRLISLLPQ